MSNCKREAQRRRWDYQRVILCFDAEEQNKLSDLFGIGYDPHQQIRSESSPSPSKRTVILEDATTQEEVVVTNRIIKKKGATLTRDVAGKTRKRKESENEPRTKKMKSSAWDENFQALRDYKEPLEKRSSRTWEDNFQALVDYKGKHGDCNVPQRCRVDPSLGFWVSKTRGGLCRVTKEQRKRLDKIGFNWETRQHRGDREWTEQFEKLKAHEEDYGAGSFSNKGNASASLHLWVGKQRKMIRSATIRADRKEKLASLGITLDTSSDVEQVPE
jgi:hypothetical protein